MNELVVIHNKEPRVKTFDIWSGLGYSEHRALKKVIFEHKKLFESKGLLISASTVAENGGKGRPDKSYFLNERQFILLMMLIKNSKESLEFKDKLEIEFHRRGEALKELNKPSAHLEDIKKILLLDAPSEWVKLFPSDFYSALMKLYGQEFISNKHTPPYCGQITRRWIYDVVLPKELHEEIDSKRANEQKHRWFTENNGRATLLYQINQVIGIAKMSRDRKHFEANCAIAFEGAPLQLTVFL